MKQKSAYILLILILTTLLSGLAQDCVYSGQYAGWLTINPEKPFRRQIGIRTIPQVAFQKTITENYRFDGELSANGYGSMLIWGDDSLNTDGKIKPYRAWLRFSGEQLEIRAGLQKINFGSASLLRPLMWFDQIDPRDPLQMTTGVYGILGRYYFLNNANIWLWVLYGNKETKGWEYFPTKKNSPEFGGRLQMPLLSGEMAFTYHNRMATADGTFLDTVFVKNYFQENRFAFDMKLDYVVGMWAEASFNHFGYDSTEIQFQKYWNLGMDYTFSIGNGLTTQVEYFQICQTEKVFEVNPVAQISAIALSYPLNIICSLNAMVYYDLKNNETYRFLSSSWKYDKWNFNLIGFWNPDHFGIYNNLGDVSLYSGAGIQFMAVFNH